MEAENSQAVTEYIEKVLSSDYDVFTRAVYAEQNQLDYFLELPKGQRMGQIDNLLKLDRFETARKNVTTLINKLESERSGKEEAAKALFSKDDSEDLARLQKDIGELGERIADLDLRLAALIIERDKVKKELEIAREKSKIEAEIEKIESERRGLNSTLEVLDSELSSVEKVSAPQKTEGFKTEKAEFEKLVHKHGSLKQVSSKLKKLKEKELDLSKKIERGKTKIEYLGHAIKDIDVEENCPLCKTKLKPAHKRKLKSEHSKLISDLEIEVELFEKDLNNVKKEYFELESAEAILAELEENIKETEHEQRAQKKVAEESNKRAKELEKKKKEVEQKLKELDKKYVELSAKVAVKADIANLELRYQDSIRQEEKIKGQIKSEQAVANERKQMIAALEKKKQDYENVLKDVDWLSQTKKLMELFSGALLKTQESLREEFVTIVNEVMGEVWPTLYPYGDITAVKLEIENRDYVLKARTTAEWINVEGITSGGERSLAALALRIAFSLALARNLGMLVLDEPTHNLDVNAIDELAITLRERLPNLIDQVFLITHEERLESAVSGYLYRLERNKELDEPTKISLIASPEI